MPGPAKGYPDIAITKFYRDTQPLGSLGGGQQLGTWYDSQLSPQFLLISGEDQVHQEGGELLAAHHLFEVEIFPIIALGECCVPFFIKFNADRIGQFLLDNLFDQFSGLLGYMRRTDEQNGFVGQFYGGNVIGIQMGRKGGCGHVVVYEKCGREKIIQLIYPISEKIPMKSWVRVCEQKRREARGIQNIVLQVNIQKAWVGIPCWA